MTILEKEKVLLKQWRTLPADKQQEALDFIAFLYEKTTRKRPLRSAAGLWADLDVNISAEDIDEARKEMWANFPRDIEL